MTQRMWSDVLAGDFQGIALKVFVVCHVLNMSAVCTEHKKGNAFTEAIEEPAPVHESQDRPADLQELRLDVDVPDGADALGRISYAVKGIILLCHMDLQSVQIYIRTFQGTGLAKAKAGKCQEFCQELPARLGRHVVHEAGQFPSVQIFFLDLKLVGHILEGMYFGQIADVTDVVIVIRPAQHGLEAPEKFIQGSGLPAGQLETLIDIFRRQLLRKGITAEHIYCGSERAVVPVGRADGKTPFLVREVQVSELIQAVTLHAVSLPILGLGDLLRKDAFRFFPCVPVVLVQSNADPLSLPGHRVDIALTEFGAPVF